MARRRVPITVARHWDSERTERSRRARAAEAVGEPESVRIEPSHPRPRRAIGERGPSAARRGAATAPAPTCRTWTESGKSAPARTSTRTRRAVARSIAGIVRIARIVAMLESTTTETHLACRLLQEPLQDRLPEGGGPRVALAGRLAR